MAEFPKNNSITLRHCILYAFLQEKSVEKAFADFRKTIGNDVIDKEEFESWFNQFRQEGSDDNKDQKTDMADILRNDKYALRACIFYESLKYLRIQKNNKCLHLSFTMYKNFCNVIGENVMEYREFDFWFYRFLNGRFGLNFERNEDKKIYKLTDLPIDVMTNIVEYLDVFDRMLLVKTSRSLRTFTQNQKLFHRTMGLGIYKHSTCIIFIGDKYIGYEERGNDCVKQFKKKEHLIRNVAHWQQAILDFNGFLQNPKLHVNNLMIYLAGGETFYNAEGALAATHQLNVKKLTLHAYSMKSLENILPFLKPGYLTTIDISFYKPKDGNVEKIRDMEQWKQAECLVMNRVNFDGPLCDLYHFKKFSIGLKSFSVKDISEMKEILFKSPYFEKCSLTLIEPVHMEAIGRELGDAIPGSSNNYHYLIPNSKEYFNIKVEERKIHIERKMI